MNESAYVTGIGTEDRVTVTTDDEELGVSTNVCRSLSTTMDVSCVALAPVTTHDPVLVVNVALSPVRKFSVFMAMPLQRQ